MSRAARLVGACAIVGSLLPAGALAQYPPPPPPGYPPPQYAPPPQQRTSFRPGPELVGFAGYQVASDLNYYSGYATIDGAASYGAALRFRLRPGETAELLWVYVPTNAHFRSSAYGGVADTSLSINYFQLGGTKGVRMDRVEPYVAASLGAAVFSAGTLRFPGSTTQLVSSDAWRFAFTVGLGLKIWLSEQLALQGEARMLAPVWFSGGTFYAGTGGSAFAVSGGIPMVEGNFTGGLVLSL